MVTMSDTSYEPSRQSEDNTAISVSLRQKKIINENADDNGSRIPYRVSL